MNKQIKIRLVYYIFTLSRNVSLNFYIHIKNLPQMRNKHPQCNDEYAELLPRNTYLSISNA